MFDIREKPQIRSGFSKDFPARVSELFEKRGVDVCEAMVVRIADRHRFEIAAEKSFENDIRTGRDSLSALNILDIISQKVINRESGRL